MLILISSALDTAAEDGFVYLVITGAHLPQLKKPIVSPSILKHAANHCSLSLVRTISQQPIRSISTVTTLSSSRKWMNRSTEQYPRTKSSTHLDVMLLCFTPVATSL